jgi:hypothetical protein
MHKPLACFDDLDASQIASQFVPILPADHWKLADPMFKHFIRINPAGIKTARS